MMQGPMDQLTGHMAETAITQSHNQTCSPTKTMFEPVFFSDRKVHTGVLGMNTG